MCAFHLIRDVAFPANDVFAIGHGFKMLWVNALRISAQMVNDQSFGYRLDEMFIGQPMCGCEFPSLAARTSNLQDSVVSSLQSSPFNTAVFNSANALIKVDEISVVHGARSIPRYSRSIHENIAEFRARGGFFWS